MPVCVYILVPKPIQQVFCLLIDRGKVRSVVLVGARFFVSSECVRDQGRGKSAVQTGNGNS